MHTFLTMSLTASIAAGVVMLLRLLLKRVPRWITCLLWAVVLLRMVCPVGFSLPVSLMPETVSSGAYIERVLPQQAQASAAEAQATAPTPATTTQTPVTRETTTVTPAAQQPTGPDRDTVLTVLWAAGGIACLAWGAVSYLRLRLRIADAILIEKNVYETDQIDSPFVCGFFRPRIYLPVGLAEPDRRYVLLHEQAHIRRRDYLTKPLAYVALCFHWFNPVLWLAYHLFGRDIETATDQAVIRSFGRTDTAGYAAALLHLGHKPSFPQAVPLAFGEENPKHRIRSVLSYKKPAFWVLFVAVVACLAACVLLLGNSGGYIDGRSIDYGKVWVTGEVPDFPKDLRRELVSIYKQYRSDVTEVRDPDLQWSRPDEGYPVAIASHNRMPWHTYRFYFQKGNAYLDFSSSIGEHYDTTYYQLGPEFQAAYEAWYAKLNDYLWKTRPDELYATQGRRVKSEADAANLLNELDLYSTIGTYRVLFNQTEPPFDMTIYFPDPPVLQVEQTTFNQYLDVVGAAVRSLSPDIASVSWQFGPKESPKSLGRFSCTASPVQNVTDFQNLFQQMKEARGNFLDRREDWGRETLSYHLGPILYLAPTEYKPNDEDGGNNRLVSFDQFYVNFSGSLGPKKVYNEPTYQRETLTDLSQLQALGLDTSQYETMTCTTVLDYLQRDTGYRLYEANGDLYFAHFEVPTGTPDYLIQMAEYQYIP